MPLSEEEEKKIREEEELRAKVRREEAKRLEAEKTKHGAIGCGLLIAIIAVIAWSSGACSEKSFEQRAADNARRLNEYCSSDKSMAAVVAERFVKQTLKAPATAKFPWGAGTALPLGDCKWQVTSYVDAQNSFGAQIRTHYRAKLQFDKASEDWRLLDLKTW